MEGKSKVRIPWNFCPTWNEGKPVLALPGERLDQATAQLDAEAVGSPLAVVKP